MDAKNEKIKLEKWMYEALFNAYKEKHQSTFPKDCEEYIWEVEDAINRELEEINVRPTDWNKSDD